MASREPDVFRAAIPWGAAGLVVVAALTDPAGWAELLALALGGAAFGVWARWPRLPMLALTAGVLVPVVLAQSTGGLEGAMFLVSLLAVVVGGWTTSTAILAAAMLAALASPWVVAAVQPGDSFGWQIWLLGISFPGVMSLIFRRQEVLRAQLVAARSELAEQAAAEERRRIARDVHDLVGHGLAAMLLQVTSARHVLRRDADSADEALRSAEEVGRRSMAELRRTVALLRSDGDSAVAAPLPGLADIGALVDAARSGGLTVEYQAAGDHDAVDDGIGLALYRIAQESLVNAARHAPGSGTVVRTSVEAHQVVLRVDSIGAAPQPVPGGESPGRGYGLQGMRERADAVGGAVYAGPTDGGWQVRCTVPLAPLESVPLDRPGAAP